MARLGTEVTALKHFPFADKQRKPGDVISAEDWERAGDAVQSALIAQDFVRVGGTTPRRHVPQEREQADESEASGDLILLLQGISAKLDRVLGHLGLSAEAETVAAKPAKAPRKKKGT